MFRKASVARLCGKGIANEIKEIIKGKIVKFLVNQDKESGL